MAGRLGQLLPGCGEGAGLRATCSFSIPLEEDRGSPQLSCHTSHSGSGLRGRWQMPTAQPGFCGAFHLALSQGYEVPGRGQLVTLPWDTPRQSCCKMMNRLGAFLKVKKGNALGDMIRQD